LICLGFSIPLGSAIGLVTALFLFSFLKVGTFETAHLFRFTLKVGRFVDVSPCKSCKRDLSKIGQSNIANQADNAGVFARVAFVGVNSIKAW
ncbi:MAG: hypothetical protein AAFY19_00705, partial [Pseudomonadota bacterium]